MSSLLPIGYAAVRTGAAIVIATRAGTRGASMREMLAQGVSDVALGLGTIAFARPGVAEYLGGVLTLLVTYAIGWETYVALRRAMEESQHVPGEDLSAASIARPVFGVWELVGVIPSILMAAIGANSREGGGDYLFDRRVLDALTAAVLGAAVLFWVSRRPPSSQLVAVLFRALGAVLLVVAVWVWL